MEDSSLFNCLKQESSGINIDIFKSSSCFYIPLFARPSQEGGAKGRYLFGSLLGI